MNQTIKNGLVGIIAGLIANVIFFFLQIGRFWENFNINLSNIEIYIYIGLPIFFVFIFVVGGRIQKRKRERWSVSVGGTRGRPLIETFKGTISMFGVKWRVSIGFGGSSNYEAYVEGCYCPKCDCELDSSTEDKFFGWKQKHIWRCPSCGFKIKRPEDYLHNERDAVARVALKEYERQQGN